MIPKDNNKGYTPLNGDARKSLAHEIAHFLDWAARERPGVWVRANEIAQVAFRISRLPRFKTEETLMVQRAMHRVGLILRKEYRRERQIKRGIGYRASVDALDVANNVLPGTVKSFQRAAERMKDVAANVDTARLPATPEGRRARAFVDNVQNVAKRLTAPSFTQQLLPPATSSGDEK